MSVPRAGVHAWCTVTVDVCAKSKLEGDVPSPAFPRDLGCLCAPNCPGSPAQTQSGCTPCLGELRGQEVLAQGDIVGCLLHLPPASPTPHTQAGCTRQASALLTREEEEVGVQALPSGCVASDQHVRLTLLGCVKVLVCVAWVASEAPAWLS